MHFSGANLTTNVLRITIKVQQNRHNILVYKGSRSWNSEKWQEMDRGGAILGSSRMFWFSPPVRHTVRLHTLPIWSLSWPCGLLRSVRHGHRGCPLLPGRKITWIASFSDLLQFSWRHLSGWDFINLGHWVVKIRKISLLTNLNKHILLFVCAKQLSYWSNLS